MYHRAKFHADRCHRHEISVTGQRNKKYVLSNSESVQCNFIIFYHVTLIQFKICCCVQNFMKMRLFFTEIWRYIDFQNGGRPPSRNCFTRLPTKSLLLAAAAYQISCQSDTQIWRYNYLNFSHIWLEMHIQAPKMGFFWGGDFGPLNVIIHNRDPKRHILA